MELAKMRSTRLNCTGPPDAVDDVVVLLSLEWLCHWLLKYRLKEATIAIIAILNFAGRAGTSTRRRATGTTADAAPLLHAVGLGTEIKAKFNPKYFFARKFSIFGGMPYLSNLWGAVHFFNHLRRQNIISQKCMPLRRQSNAVDAEYHHYHP